MCDATTQQQSSALSRTGFVILYSGCPVLWHSKLQTEVALSTCEAEYIALSQCARVLIPLQQLIKNISDVFDPNDGAVNLLNSTSKCFNSPGKSIILENNTACIAVANDDNSKVCPRTRHLSIKWHHFRDQIKED